MGLANIIQSIIEQFATNTFTQSNGTRLLNYNESSMPKFKHIVFKPLSEKGIAYLQSVYKLHIPQILLEVYSFTNGANLFSYERHIGNIVIPGYRLNIFGVPGPNIRDINNLEPYNIAIENLKRPKGCPDTWLKFGVYENPADELELDLYLDTNEDNGTVYGIPRERFDIIQKWDSLEALLNLLRTQYGK